MVAALATPAVCRVFLVQYRLRNGACGTLHVPATDSFAAIDIAFEIFGAALCRCVTRPA